MDKIKNKYFLRIEEWILFITFLWISALRFFTGNGFSFIPVLNSLFKSLLGWVFIVLMCYWFYTGYELIIFGYRDKKFFYKSFKNIFFRFRDLLPIPLLGFLFYTLGGGRELTHLLGLPNATPFLVGLENLIFHGQTTQYMEIFINPFLTDYFTFIYSFYPWLIILTGLWLSWRGDYKVFRGYVASLVFASCIAYVIFVLLPSASPIYVLSYSCDLVGGAFSSQFDNMLDMVRSAENDCCLFPSLHVALSTISWIYLSKANKKFTIPVGLLAVSEWISTIYLRRHYGVDVLGGLLLAIICYHLSQKLIENITYSQES